VSVNFIGVAKYDVNVVLKELKNIFVNDNFTMSDKIKKQNEMKISFLWVFFWGRVTVELLCTFSFLLLFIRTCE
jgi:hypothetical protein